LECHEGHDPRNQSHFPRNATDSLLNPAKQKLLDLSVDRMTTSFMSAIRAENVRPGQVFPPDPRL